MLIPIHLIFYLLIQWETQQILNNTAISCVYKYSGNNNEKIDTRIIIHNNKYEWKWQNLYTKVDERETITKCRLYHYMANRKAHLGNEPINNKY